MIDDHAVLIDDSEAEQDGPDSVRDDPENQQDGGQSSPDGQVVDCQPVDVSPVWAFFGVCLVITSGFTFTASNIIQKFYVPTLAFWQLLLHRSIIQTSLLILVCGFQGLRHGRGVTETLLGPPGVRVRTVLQGLLGGLLLLCMFNGIRHVPLGNMSAIMFCTPVFTFLFAPCMLREQCGLFRSLIGILMVGGVTLITRPQFVFGYSNPPINGTNETKIPDMDGAGKELLTSLGYVTAICVPLLSAFISLLTRQCKQVPPYVLMFWFGAGGLVVSIPSVVAFRPDHLFDLTGIEWLSTFVIIAFGILGNLCYTFAVRWVSPSKANVFRSFEVILNFVLQLHFENASFFPENAVGIALLVSAVVIMSYENEILKKFEICVFNSSKK